ncbi:hypothetical protein C5B42_03955 [Candidatus Cerribacteria bacterium 'Amazon FNV 2010 28 9']|uniref:Uncharacterized protein n=1 Tax=Candidatus Cerribacteria bacterium 'Amazon FNV 2010 28 9' TaxID=2081795 RepID=A0A317JT95_9BACT|nr:MAG: hypothetical protein C5B42_03955 [Candidatus Cerribacteria bacterium 'Amazon FNV 2010 28 9']
MSVPYPKTPGCLIRGFIFYQGNRDKIENIVDFSNKEQKLKSQIGYVLVLDEFTYIIDETNADKVIQAVIDHLNTLGFTYTILDSRPTDFPITFNARTNMGNPIRGEINRVRRLRVEAR